jgi:hypothetical protein
VNGKLIKLRKLRMSAKGAQVDGARVHVAGLGTVYVQVYEERKAAVMAHARPPAQLPTTTPDVRALFEMLKGLNDRLESLREEIPAPAPSL